jgi:hypothetical protein
MITPKILATNEMQDPASPLSIHDDMAAQDGVLDGGSSPAEAAKDTTVAMVINSDSGSQKLATQDYLPVHDEHNMDPEISQDSRGLKDALEELTGTEPFPGDVVKQDDKSANEDSLNSGCPNYRAETAASDSGSHMSPNPEPASSSVKGRQSTKRRTKTTIDPDDLPSKDDELSAAQIAVICSQPKKIRQGYTRYFASSGTIRAAYKDILLERRPDGELRFSEDILRSCIPKWKEHLEGSELGESTQPGEGHNRKRKGTATAAKRIADEDTEPPKKSKKPKISKSEELCVHQENMGHIFSEEPRQHIRIRPVITPRTALARGLPATTSLCTPSTALQESSSEPLVSNAQPHDQNQPSQIDASNGHRLKPSAVPNMDNRKSFFGKNATQATRVLNLGTCSLLDPNYLAQFAQYLTGEIQQLDLAIVGIAHGAGPHDQGHRYALRRLRDVLIDFRDLCVDMEIEQRRRTVTKSRADMDDV